MSQKRQELPLSRLKVVDLSRLVAGNMTTLQFADFGADVIKVEQPGRGDPLRAWHTAGKDLWWREYGRNKRSIALDLKDAAELEILRALVKRADILVENFVPGKLEVLGLSHVDLLQDNPRLVILAISGWGRSGAYRERPGFGTLVEAMSGFAAMTGFPEGPPTMPPVPIADMIAGLYGAFAGMVAVHYARKTGQGQVIDLSLIEPIVSVLGPVAAAFAETGQSPARKGNRSPNNAPRNTYLTRDGKWIVISVSTPAMAERFFRLMDLEWVLEDPRFSSHEARLHHGDQIDAIVAETLGRYDEADILEKFSAGGVAGAPVLDIAGIVQDPHIRSRAVFETVSVPGDGDMPMHAVIPRLSRTPGRIRRPGPAIDADRSAILQDIDMVDPSNRSARKRAG